MKTITKRIHRDFAPLNIALSVACVTPDSPLTQVYDGHEGSFLPDRRIAATILQPDISVSAADGSVTTTITIKDIIASSVKWYLDNKEIGKTWQAGTDFDIVTSANDDTRGRLVIKRNVPIGEMHKLRFEAQLYDQRENKYIDLVSEDLQLTTSDKSSDEFTATLECAPAQDYNIFEDPLYAYEYEVAHGLRDANTNDYNAARTSPLSYLRTFSVAIRQGSELFSGTTSIRIERLKGKEWVDMATESTRNELVSMSALGAVLDLRLLSGRQTYRLTPTITTPSKKSLTLTPVTFSVVVAMKPFTVQSVNEADITSSKGVRHDKAVFQLNGQVLKHGEAYFNCEWFTKAPYDGTTDGVFRGRGSDIVFDIADVGVGDNASDCEFEQWMDVEQREVFSFLADPTHGILTDKNGNAILV